MRLFSMFRRKKHDPHDAPPAAKQDPFQAAEQRIVAADRELEPVHAALRFKGTVGRESPSYRKPGSGTSPNTKKLQKPIVRKNPLVHDDRNNYPGRHRLSRRQKRVLKAERHVSEG